MTISLLHPPDQSRSVDVARPPGPPLPAEPPPEFADRTDDQLADDLCTWAGRVAAGEAELLALIAEFDRRQAWAVPGLLSCAHWLSWRIGLSPGTARERVRVARALTELPVLTAALQAGRVSYSQVRALTRVASPGDEQRWVDLARGTTAGQLERVVRGVRRARAADEHASDPETAERVLRCTRTYDDDGNVVYRIVLPVEQAAVLDTALEAARRSLEYQEDDQPKLEDEPLPAPRPSLAQALLSLAERVVDDDHQQRPSAARQHRLALTAQVDPLSGWARLRDGELLPPRVAGRAGLAVDDRPLRPLNDADLTRHDQGRTRRDPPAPLRALIGTLDGERCRFPGCTRVRRLHAHHVRYWSDGGPTDLDNLILLCHRHHRLVHRDQFELQLEGRRLTVTGPDGRIIPHVVGPAWRPAHELDPSNHVGADTLPPDMVERRIDLDYVVAVLAQQAA